MFFSKKGKSLGFYDLLIRQAEAVFSTVDALCVYCIDPSVERGDYVKNLEKEADNVRKNLVDEINRTFITPIDREDLFRLSSSVDDLADYSWTTIKELRIYDVLPDANLLAMAEILRDMASGLIECMKHLEKDRAAVVQHAIHIKKLENVLNVRFHQSIAELFELDDIKKMLKYREVYNHLNHASDKGDACADILQDIVVKL